MKFVEIGSGAYQLIEPFEIQTPIIGHSVIASLYELKANGKLRLKRFFAWDGPTGAKNTKDFIVSSGIHDVFCEMIRKGLIPATEQCKADDFMWQLNGMKQVWSDGEAEEVLEMHPFRREYAYAAVRTFQHFNRTREGSYRSREYEIKLLPLTEKDDYGPQIK